MLRGLWKLTWLEVKIFMREPLGLVGTVGIPVFLFLFFGRTFGARASASGQVSQLLKQEIPIFVALFVALSAAISLTAVISIYREGGILKRLRATPLRPPTILCAHVLVKLLFTALTMALMVVAGRRYYPVPLDWHLASFSLAGVVSTVSILSMGFVIRRLVPTARFGRAIASAILCPTVAVSGLFRPIASLPGVWPAVSSFLPTTHAVALMRGAMTGESWSAAMPHLAALVLATVICVAISSRIFRWE